VIYRELLRDALDDDDEITPIERLLQEALADVGAGREGTSTVERPSPPSLSVLSID